MTSSAVLPTPRPAAAGPTANSERPRHTARPYSFPTPSSNRASRCADWRLAKDPNDGTALASLAEICRKQGNLSEAAALYERLSRFKAQDGEAEYMHAILEAPPVPPRFRPPPFVFLKDFLPSSFHDTLLPFVLSIQDKLVPALVGKGEYKPDVS